MHTSYFSWSSRPWGQVTFSGFTLPSKENFRIKNIDRKYSLLRIPLVGWVRLTRRGGVPYEDDTPKQVVLRHDGHRWRAFVSYEVEVERRLDFSARCFGWTFLLPTRFKEERSKAEAVSAKDSLAKVSRKIANSKNWIHQTTKEIAGKCGAIVEDLKVRHRLLRTKIS